MNMAVLASLKWVYSHLNQITWGPGSPRGNDKHEEHYEHGRAGVAEVAASIDRIHNVIAMR